MEDTEDNEKQPTGAERAEKRLARGLEDVSHLFLSQVSPPASPVQSPPTPKVENPRDAGARLLRRPAPERLTAAGAPPGSAVTQNQLVSLLHQNAGVLEEGLRAIDSNIPSDVDGVVDLVAIDGRSRLVIVDLDVAGGEALVLRGICHVDWFARNVPIVRRMYASQTIDFAAEPRLFLVGPRFSPVVERAVQKITSVRITCVTYHLVTLPNGTGVFFERT